MTFNWAVEIIREQRSKYGILYAASWLLGRGWGKPLLAMEMFLEQGPRAKGPRAKGPRGEGTEARGPRANLAEGQGADGQGAEGPYAEGQGAEGQGAKGKGAEGPGAEGQGAEGPGAESWRRFGSRGPSRRSCGLATLWASNKALGRTLEISWQNTLLLDRMLADFYYVNDGVILGAVVGDVPGVGGKVAVNVVYCVGDGVGPNVDVWDCYDGSTPCQCVCWLLWGR